MGKTVEEYLEHQIGQNDKILALLKGQSNRGSYGDTASSSPSGSGMLGGMVSGALGSAKAVTTSLDDLWRGTLTVTSGFDVLNKAMATHGGTLGKAFADVSSKIGGAILDTNNALNQSLKYGANFDNNLSEYDRLIKGARMTHEEYNDMIKKGAEEMRGLGSNINTSQKNFLLMAKALQEGEIGTKLKEIGLHADDLNAVLAGAMANRRGMDMSDNATKKAAIESSERLVVAMEETARLTGESRKDQIEEMKKKSEDARIQMKISMMDKEALSRYQAGMQQMHMLGPAAEKLFRDTFLGKITKEGSTAVAATGTSAADIQRYALASRDNTPEGMARAKELGDTALTRNIEWNKTQGAMNFGMYSEGPAADLMAESFTKNKLLPAVNAKIDEVQNKTGETIDVKAALELSRDAVKKSMKQQNADGSPITDPGSAVAVTINKLDRSLSDLTAGSTVYFGGLNNKLGESIQKLGDFNKVLSPRTQEQADPRALFNEAKSFFSSKNLPEAFREAKQNQTHEKTTPEQMAAPVKPVEKRASGSPSFENFLNGGTKFNDMFEKFDVSGTPAELHGEELVATRKQMEKFVEKMLPPPVVTQSTSKSTELPSLPPIDFKDIKLPTNAAATSTITPPTLPHDETSKLLAQSLNSVSDRLKDLTAELHNFKPVDHINEVVERVSTAQKPATTTPAATPSETPKKELSINNELKKIAEEIKRDEEKKAATTTTVSEPKHELPKILDLGIKTAEDLNKFLFGGISTQTSPKVEPPKSAEETKAVESIIQNNVGKVASQIQTKFDDIIPKSFENLSSTIKLPKDDVKSDTVTPPPAVTAMVKQLVDIGKTVTTSISTHNSVVAPKPVQQPTNVVQKPKIPDVSQLDSNLLNIAKFNKAMESGSISKIGMAQMDLSDAGKAAEDKLGPSSARIALQKKREALENASFDYEELKAANTKPSLEAAEILAKKKAEVAKLSLSYEDELIKTKGRILSHSHEEVKNSEIKNKNDEKSKAQQVAKALADEKKFMKEHGPGSEEKTKTESAQVKTDLNRSIDAFNSTKFKLYNEDEEKVRARQAESKEKSSSLFDSISNFFTGSNKPAFASGNVKYEQIPQAEIDASNKRALEGIGKIDNSPEAIAAQKAELARQADSSRYKQKEPEKPKIEEVKKPVETKEDAHIKEMYKKYGFETFKDYNARLSAETKQSQAQIKATIENKKDLSPVDVAPKPTQPPKPVEQPAPVPSAQPQAQVVEKQITLKDIHDVLMQLNKTMIEMAHHTEQINGNGQRQISAINKQSNSRW